LSVAGALDEVTLSRERKVAPMQREKGAKRRRPSRDRLSRIARRRHGRTGSIDRA
jgi:hypothetical protein